MTWNDETVLLEAMIRGEEAAFRHAIRQIQPAMSNLARSIVGEKIADEVVQEAWVSVMKALPRFERRSSLKTWVLRIVANEAKSRLRRENRHVSLEAMLGEDTDLAARFDERGHWRRDSAPIQWSEDSPEALLSSQELADCLDLVIAALPDMQAATLQLREQQGYALAEICNILEVSESNVRVLLHRARTRLFTAIEHFEQTGECCEHQ